MKSGQPYSIPYCRSLSANERAILLKVLKREAPRLVNQVERLKVIARCGCGECPTVLFSQTESAEPLPHGQYKEVASYFGKGSNDGLVGIIIWESEEQIAELEFYSIDGHDLYEAPDAENIEPYA
jgi:hypothetical protein